LGCRLARRLVRAGGALEYEYLGIADHASLCGLPEMVEAAAASRIRPLYGAAFPFLNGQSAIAFVETANGYGNLCQLVTDWQALSASHPATRAGGIPALAPEAAKRFFANADALAGLTWIVNDAALYGALRAGGVETYWRVGPTLASPPRGINAAVFVPGPFLPAPRDFDAHRLLRAVGGATAFDRIPAADASDRDRVRAPVLMGMPDAYLRSAEEYAEAFAVHADAIERADILAARLGRFKPGRDTLHPPPPESGRIAENNAPSALATLRRLAYEGAAIRYGEVGEAVRRRLEHELDLIDRKGFAEYFLVVHDIVNRLAGGDGRVRRGRSITCGRGSGVACLVNYCLGVTNVDALKHNLMFERFLNEARKDPPDIDVDFAWDERDGVLDKVFVNYGDKRVARVANHNRYDWRGAFRAAARTLGFSDPEITRRLRESPSVYSEAHPGRTPPPEAVAPSAPRALRKLEVLRRVDAPDWNLAERLAERLVGIPHCLSMHCGGVVMAPGTIARIVPTIMSRKGQPTIQWEKDGAEDMGLVKIDLLGNRSLAIIRDAVKAIAKDTGTSEEDVIPINPEDDPATRRLVERGDTFGVFYLESPAMRLLMAKARRGDFAHAVIHSSIIRPAANAFINEYLERLHGKSWQPEHPLLAGLFDESYGIPVYQEDVVKLAMALAGYDYARADGIRKCLGKHDARERLAAAFPELAGAARARGVDEATLAGFRRTLMSMIGYSFCKPHSASYAQVSYEAAYLRAHHPAYFMAAVLSNGGGFYSAQAYVSEAMRLGLQVLGPDVNRSEPTWRAEGRGAIRTGLMMISGLSRAAIAAVVATREKGGRYIDLEDFLQRVSTASDDRRRLALVGALDDLAPELNRPQILWRAGQNAGDEMRVDQRSKNAVSGSLFSLTAPNSIRESRLSHRLHAVRRRSCRPIRDASASRRNTPPLDSFPAAIRWRCMKGKSGKAPGYLSDADTPGLSPPGACRNTRGKRLSSWLGQSPPRLWKRNTATP
jgi:DNA polymerase-3 subunit alpha/error-prone DNA polymerase